MTDVVNVPPLPSYLTGNIGTTTVTGSGTAGLNISNPTLPSLPTLAPYITGVQSALDVTNPNGVYASQGGVNGMTTSQVAANTLAGAAQGNSAVSFLQTFLTWLKESALPVMLVIVGLLMIVFSVWAIFDRSATIKTASRFVSAVS